MRPRYVVRITPADVGERVTIRYRLRDPGQGPGMSDVIGVLESWEDGELRLRRKDGAVLVIGEDQLLAGKPMPPPPPPRPPRRP